MVTIFEKNTTAFKGLGLGALLPSSCRVTEELNGGFELVMEHPYDPYGKWERIQNNNILYASTPRGMEPFRIYRVKPTLEGVTVNARHIFYDLQDNLSVLVNHTGSAEAALDHLAGSLAYAMPFSFATNITKTGTMFGEYINPVQALLSDSENVDSFVKVYGGELLRKGFSVSMLESIGADRGVSIRYGKNLIGLEVDEDISELKTRIIVQNDAGTVYTKDSPYINEYTYPKIHIVGAGEAAINEMQRMAEALLEEGIDLPNINIRVDFQELSKTEEYKNYAVLEEVQLGDTVTVIHEKMHFRQKRKVISYTWDCLLEKYDSVELGDFLPSLATTTNRLQQMVKSQQGKMTEIEVSIDGVRVEIADTEKSLTASINATAESIRSDMTAADGALSSRITQTAKDIRSEVSDVQRGLSTQINQTAERIDLIVTGDSDASEITLTENMISAISSQVDIEAPEINLSGYVTFKDLRGSGEDTVIDGDLITTGKVNADHIGLYGWMKVYKEYEDSGYTGTGGYIGYSTGDDGVNATTAGIAVSSSDDDIYLIATTSGIRMTAYDQAVVVTENGISTTDGVHSTSDARAKNTISYDMERYEDFFSRLQPSFYKMNNGRSGRYHIGFIAQDVEAAILDSGITTQDFAGLVQHKPDEEQVGEFPDQYYLRYSEFIALNTYMIQKLMKRVEELEKKLEGGDSSAN